VSVLDAGLTESQEDSPVAQPASLGLSLEARMKPHCTRPITAAMVALILVVGACEHETTSPNQIESAPQLESASAQAALSFRQVSTGHLYSCGVTTDDRAFCWGYNGAGQLGDGTTTQRIRPTAVAGGLRFREVATALSHSCGITTDSRAYCWGDNSDGQLGDGTTTQRLTPVAVSGGRLFRQVTTGWGHTCAINPFDRAFCWGAGGGGQLGDGTNTTRSAPTLVRDGGLRFGQINAGSQYTCAITTGNRAYCWGVNSQGQLGDRSRTWRSLPTEVFGGFSFRQVSAYIQHTCAVTTDNRAYCWGFNGSRELGDGTDWPRRLRPVPVLGGRRFTSVAAGGGHSCGVATNQRAYCWGDNGFGRLGTGDGENHPTPAPVQVDRQFTNLDAGTFHGCGVTLANRAYCWGYNEYGQLGDGNGGSGVVSPTPVPVAGSG
jgi:alpha-tubulin suppressor-like RCC1 family protein